MTSSVFGASDGKANFEALYLQPDPRDYYRGLGSLGYEVPEHGRRVFDDLLRARAGNRPTVVDLCCSYGVNAALMKHDLELDDLYEHYGSESLADARSDSVAAIDREFFAEHRRSDAPRVVGVDSAQPAVSYAVSTGLLDAGFAENLEVDEPSSELAEEMSRADLLTVTGGVGYVTDRTFNRLMRCADEHPPPWVACLCLRTVPYEPVAEALARHGLVTEELEDVTFPQRRFADARERDAALQRLAALGIDADGKESEGRYHVAVYVSRPPADVAARSAADLLSRAAGDVADVDGHDLALADARRA